MKNSRSLTVYLGSSGRCRPFFKEQAARLGAEIAASGYKLVYGGMDAGLMGILADAVSRNGGEVLGIIPRKIKDILRFHKNLSEHILVDTLWERKRLLFERGDALAVFPGGFGTLDEALEVLYWARLGRHAKPVIFVNLEGYWDNALAHLRGLPDLPPELFSSVDSVEELVPAIKALSSDEEDKNDETDLPHLENDIVQETKAPILVRDATIEETYRLVTALGLKQVGAHDRPIGLLNMNGDFDNLIEWIGDAAREKFITEKCPRLMACAASEETLLEALEIGEPIVIDLITEKWGIDAETAEITK